ncbi:MAG: glycosyltransferase family 2 protein [Verrucomicrobiia bacterium]
MIFSVVTPSLNCKDFILRNIESVRSQGLNSDEIEHWVIDGGSTDGTLDILKAQKDIKWISEPDRGLSDAVNKGIQRARGEWIIWLNADDYLAKDACKVFLQHAKANPDIKIFCGELVVLRYDGTVEQIYPAWDYNLKDLLGTRTGMNQASTFVHREVYEKVGLLDVNIRYAMDYEWLVRAMHYYKCQPINYVLAYYQRRKSSIMDAHMKEHFETFLKVRRQFNQPYFSKAEFRIRFYIYTDWLRQIRPLRKGVRFVKRIFGKEPLHPM